MSAKRYECGATFTKIWWGRMQPQTDEDEPYGASPVVKVRNQKVDPDTDRTVFISYLPKLEAGPAVPEMEAQLAEIFEDYSATFSRYFLPFFDMLLIPLPSSPKKISCLIQALRVSESYQRKVGHLLKYAMMTAVVLL